MIYAALRRGSGEDPTAMLSSTRRTRHSLHTAFRTLHASDYTEIATVEVDRCVLDLAVSPTDAYVAVVEMDSMEDLDSAARIYEVEARHAISPKSPHGSRQAKLFLKYH